MTNSENARRDAEIKARLEAATPGEWDAISGFVFLSKIGPVHKGIIATAGNADAEFMANAKPDIIWQRERIKELKAELENAHKWAKQWKRRAKYYRWRAQSTERVLFDKEIASIDKTTLLFTRIYGMKKRVAALENAARGCVTCVHYANVKDVASSQSRCATCGREKLTNWEFAEERFAPQESAGND